jgi:hypothetical protein
MKNIAAKDRALPMKALCQVKDLNLGLKFGVPAALRIKQARFITKNVNWYLFIKGKFQ